MAIRYTLGKTERLKSRKSIDRLFEKGHRFNVGSLRVYYYMAEVTGLRAGVSVSARSFSKATDRNRIKRLLRETYRLQKHLLAAALTAEQGLDLFFIYTEKQLPEFSVLKESMHKALQKIIKALEKS